MAPRARKNDVLGKWTKKEILNLITSIKNQLKEEDTCLYSRRIQQLNWNQIKVGSKSVNECKLQFGEVIKKIHRTRTLAEILSDVDLESLFITKQNSSKIKSDLPLHGYSFLKEVSVKLEKLPQKHNIDSKWLLLECSKQLQNCGQVKDEPKEPMRSFNFFKINLPAEVDFEAASKAYQNLSKEERIIYIEMSRKAKIQYKLDLAKYVMSLTSCELTKYLNRIQLETEARNEVITNLKTSNNSDNNNKTSSNPSGIHVKQKRQAEETAESENKKIRMDIQKPIKAAIRDVKIVTPVVTVNVSKQADSKNIQRTRTTTNEELLTTELNEDRAEVSFAAKMKIKQESNRPRPYYSYLNNIYSGMRAQFGRLLGNKNVKQ